MRIPGADLTPLDRPLVAFAFKDVIHRHATASRRHAFGNERHVGPRDVLLKGDGPYVDIHRAHVQTHGGRALLEVVDHSLLHRFGILNVLGAGRKDRYQHRDEHRQRALFHRSDYTEPSCNSAAMRSASLGTTMGWLPKVERIFTPLGVSNLPMWYL